MLPCLSYCIFQLNQWKKRVLTMVIYSKHLHSIYCVPRAIYYIFYLSQQPIAVCDLHCPILRMGEETEIQRAK